MDITDKLNFIKIYDPDGAARIERLLSKKDRLIGGNVYGERFTERQFYLVFNPLLEAALERARILKTLAEGEKTVIHISTALHLEMSIVFNHIKELIRRNLIEIKGYDDRDPVYCLRR
ncbi:MAG: transcriptional regulator [Syntrophorhabdaceae bacterium]|nr:transcriptional regulator [Syntrophorhabdaceae bacterium]